MVHRASTGRKGYCHRQMDLQNKAERARKGSQWGITLSYIYCMMQPKGYQTKNKEGMACKLKKVLCGFKQAAKFWN